MKLVKGMGSETEGACWMSGIHWFTRTDRSWSDHPACVSPVIATLAIALNDWCSDGEREALIGEHFFTPAGTATGREDELTRAFLCADRAVRVFAPIALRAAGLTDLATKLESLPPVVNSTSARAAMAAAEVAMAAAEVAMAAMAAWAAARAAARAARAAIAAWAAARAARAARAAAEAAEAAEAARAAGAAAEAAEAARAAEGAAETAAEAARAARAAEAQTLLLDLILDCCAIGTKAEVCPVKTRQEVLEYLER